MDCDSPEALASSAIMGAVVGPESKSLMVHEAVKSTLFSEMEEYPSGKAGITGSKPLTILTDSRKISSTSFLAAAKSISFVIPGDPWRRDDPSGLLASEVPTLFQGIKTTCITDNT